MKVVIVGAHGKVSLLLGRLLHRRGHSVSGLIRSEAQSADLSAAGVAPLVVDIERADRDKLARILAGHDAVVFSAGAGGGDIERTYAVDRDAAIRVTEAAVSAGVPRFVMVSTIHAGHSEAVPELADYLIAKGEADRSLEASGLSWTIVRPGRLASTEGTGRVLLGGPDDSDGPAIPRADVAQLIADVLDLDQGVQRIFSAFGGDAPIELALKAL